VYTQTIIFETIVSRMQITLNGKSHQTFDGASLAALIDQLNLSERRLAVEVNEELVPRSEHPSYALQPGDRVEIVQAIGGG
jgi:thiamine biosynthesis protein ThiS